jgi:hypothetical protein
MPFDPARPHDHATIEADELRAQFNGLKDIIDAIAAGGITGAVVDSVTTLGPGQPASVTATLIGTVLHLSLAIPEGQPGLQGLQGTPGAPGQPFANVIIDGVNTLNSGEPASVWISFDGVNVHLVFNIPRGPQGEQGIQGPPGEVTNAAMASAIATAVSTAIAGTSNNTNSVATMDTPFDDNPAAEAIRQAFNALVLTLRR